MGSVRAKGARPRISALGPGQGGLALRGGVARGVGGEGEGRAQHGGRVALERQERVAGLDDGAIGVVREGEGRAAEARDLAEADVGRARAEGDEVLAERARVAEGDEAAVVGTKTSGRGPA